MENDDGNWTITWIKTTPSIDENKSSQYHFNSCTSLASEFWLMTVWLCKLPQMFLKNISREATIIDKKIPLNSLGNFLKYVNKSSAAFEDIVTTKIESGFKIFW